MRRCPKCGGDKFVVTGHVVQEWLVDECGLCEEVLDDCICVTHDPDDQDIWQCFKCGFDGPGRLFYVEDIEIEGTD